MSIRNVNARGGVLLASDLQHPALWQSVEKFEFERHPGVSQLLEGLACNYRIVYSDGHVTRR
jgi:hypothetical protein